MALFIGNTKNSDAANCALKIHHVVEKIVRPTVEARLPSLVKKKYKLSHCTGIASGTALIVRGGVRGSNDLVSIGRAPNVAAKLSEVRSGSYRSFVTEDVFSRMNTKAKYASEPQKIMWKSEARTIGGQSITVYKSSWLRKP